MKLNKGQEQGVKAAKEWWNDRISRHSKIFTISGYAGTGKSTLVSHLIEGLELDPINDVKYVAFSGAAAVALSQKNTNATTIHKLIYDPFMDKKTHKVGFVLKDTIEGSPSLIVIDEIGMVNTKILEDLKSFKIPIIALGDDAQQRNFSGDSNTLLDHADVRLTEPMRQSLDNPILALAYKILDNKPITLRDTSSSNLIVLPKSQLPDECYLNADQIIAGRNVTCDQITSHIRQGILHLESPFPYENEKVMCLKNNWDKFINFGNYDQYLVNGLAGYASNFQKYNEKFQTFKFDFTPSFFDNDITPDKTNTFRNILADGIYFRDGIKKDDIFYDKDYKDQYDEVLYRRKVDFDTNYTHIDKFTFGYAMTVFKAQGSEYKNLLYINDPWGRYNQKKAQMYTAVTRASENLIIGI